jgi:hypothetical protein
MSRCFPFPPPGYEATPRREKQQKDLLKKVSYSVPFESLAIIGYTLMIHKKWVFLD